MMTLESFLNRKRKAMEIVEGKFSNIIGRINSERVEKEEFIDLCHLLTFIMTYKEYLPDDSLSSYLIALVGILEKMNEFEKCIDQPGMEFLAKELCALIL